MGMTDKKILELLDGYEKKLHIPIRIDTKKELVWEKIEHAIRMIPKMRKFMEEGRREKVFRWLGFLQCVFWMTDIYTIKELADHSRPTKSDLKDQYPGHSFDANCSECTPALWLAIRSCTYAKEYLEAIDEAVAIK